MQGVQRRAAALGPGWPLPDETGDEAIRARPYPPQGRSGAMKAEVGHERVQREMGRRGVTMTLLWDEYAGRAVLAGRTPCMHSSFCRRHQRWVDANPEVAMRIEWRPGEWCQVDWCGDTMRVRDPDTGERAWVEGAALIVGRQAIAALRDRTFMSPPELSQALRERVDEIDARALQRGAAGTRSSRARGGRACSPCRRRRTSFRPARQSPSSPTATSASTDAATLSRSRA